MDDVKITFVMIVTDPDVVIADYAVRSYVKIKGIKFALRIYSNWVSSSLKRRYFPRWRKLPFVEIIEPDGQTDENKPTDRSLEGPFERCDTIWDRELKKIDAPYHATVDADFEIHPGLGGGTVVACRFRRSNSHVSDPGRRARQCAHRG